MLKQNDHLREQEGGFPGSNRGSLRGALDIRSGIGTSRTSEGTHGPDRSEVASASPDVAVIPNKTSRPENPSGLQVAGRFSG